MPRSKACQISVRAQQALTLSTHYRSTGWVYVTAHAYSKKSGWRPWFTGTPFAPASALTPLAATTPPAPAGTTAVTFGIQSSAKRALTVRNVTVAGAAKARRFPVFKPAFPRTDGLITNPYGRAARSPDWTVTAGSLFARAGTGWTGLPDDGFPGPKSDVFTGSAVYRMHTRRHDFTDVAVSFELSIAGQVTTPYTPAHDYDGVHIWLRHTSQFQLYAASVARRDGTLVIKKKCPGGPSNGGTYYPLGRLPGRATKLRTWVKVGASARTDPGGTVTIVMSLGGRPVLSVTDDGVGCAPITAPAPIGIRGDNTNFRFRAVVAQNL